MARRLIQIRPQQDSEAVLRLLHNETKALRIKVLGASYLLIDRETLPRTRRSTRALSHVASPTAVLAFVASSYQA